MPGETPIPAKLIDRNGAVRGFAKELRLSTVATNTLWNYGSVAWLACLNFVTLPMYLRLLGKTEWGLVAVCVTIQNALTLLDLGFGQIMPKSIAEAHGDVAREARALAVYIRIYLILALFGFLAGQLLARPLALYWFRTSEIDPARLEMALRLVLVQFVFQFANNAHVGYWNGTQRQVVGNVRQVAFTTMRHCAALLSVAYFARSAFGYLLPFVVITAAEWTCNRQAVLRAGGFSFWKGPPLEMRHVLEIVRIARGFAVAILVGLLVTQLDRIVLSKTQDITQYGIYVIVANAGLAFLNLQYPVLRAFFPKIVREKVASAEARSGATRQLLTIVVALCVIPCLIVAGFAPQLLRLWTQNAAVVDSGAFPLRLILIAVAMNAIYNVIYQHIVAQGQSRIVVAINAACLMSSLATVWLVGSGIGIALGGLMWVASTLTQLALGGVWAWTRARLT